jgi:hypothetical protein
VEKTTGNLVFFYFIGHPVADCYSFFCEEKREEKTTFLWMRGLAVTVVRLVPVLCGKSREELPDQTVPAVVSSLNSCPEARSWAPGPRD